jgi:dienelactone hydrolase
MSSWPQSYVLHELAFDSRVPALLGGEALSRHAHGYLAVPTTPAAPGGYPVALALNGHGGSARDVFDPTGMYWYGDSFARRGFLVVAVDVGHRPLVDRASVYADDATGDDPGTGNGLHPAIEPPGASSDWEEDGERAWDAMRALDYALGRPDVNRAAVVAVGLSMGGEITDWVGAMDPRVGVAVAAGSPSDLAIMRLHGNHPCWQWQRGDVREYLDPGDLEALVAPRVLVRETGLADGIYSDAAAPFATAKEVVRRAGPAFSAAGGQLIHYLHFDSHAFHVGQFCPEEGNADGVTTPTVTAPHPSDPWSTTWAADPGRTPIAPSLFALLPGGGA